MLYDRARTSEDAQHIAVADLLRAVAIAGVVLVHFVELGTVLQPLWDGALSIGFWSVDAFFVLSGFLLGQPYLAALLGLRPFPSSRLYAMRRFLRIWPAYAVAVVVSAMLVISYHGKETSSFGDIAAHLLFLHGFSSAYLVGAGNGALWTMAVDAQFYVLLPIAAFAFSRLARGIHTDRRPRAIALAIASTIALSLVARAIASAMPFRWDDDFALLYAVQRNALGMACAFGAGLLLALQFVRYRNISARRWPLYLLAGIASEAFSMDFAALWPASNSAVRDLAYDVLGTLSVTCLLVVGLTLRKRSVRFSRFVSARIILDAAAIAYAVYLVHWPIREAMFSIVFGHLHVPLGSPMFVIMLVAGTLPIVALTAYLLHRFVEQPFLNVKARLAG